MKKHRGMILLLTAIMAAACVQPVSAKAADTYEWESGTIYDTGTEKTETVSLAGASGGKAVSLLDAGDSVTLNVNVPSAGAYTLSIRYSQPYDENGKIQNIIVNGKQTGTVSFVYTDHGKFDTSAVTANLSAGENSITVESSWGWTYLDALTVTPWKGGTVSSDAALSNPKASQKAQSLYAFLCDTYGKNVIAGQQESTWMGSEDYEFNIIQNASGKLPVIRGLDYMGEDFSGCNRRAKAWAAKGGIVTICWHCGADFKGSHTESMAAEPDWSKLLTPGTSEYNAPIAGMDKGAAALKELQEADVPVIWRPFHEFDGAWFWWGKGGAENFKKLWRLMYDRYTNEWGLNNLIWNLGYSGDVKGGWYPGDEYVDIIGADTYVNHTDSLVSMYQRAAGVSSKPVCLHENGPIPDPEKMKADGAKWLWFMTWHTSFIDSNAINTAGYLKQVYNSDYMLTLDEIPDVYSYGVTSIEPQQGEEEQDDTPVLIGDVNVDGVIDKADVTLLIKYLMTSAELTEQQAVRADFNEDGKINAADLTLLKQQFVNQAAEPEQDTEKTQENPIVNKTDYQFDDAKVYTEYPRSYANAIPQAGTVVKENYNGINGGNTLNVYLPYGYDSSKQYNVFYLIPQNSKRIFHSKEGTNPAVTATK